MRKKRRFIYDECNHVYQRAVNGFNIFYDTEDFLLCLTILTTSARKYKVKILEVCFMIDHIHLLLAAETCSQMAAFIRHYSSVFVHEYNIGVSRRGQLLKKSFGSAPRKGDKKTRSTIVYIGNNPVEKKLCRSAEEYRWGFLAYINDRYAFSNKTHGGGHSKELRRAIREVKVDNELNLYLNPMTLKRLFRKLDQREADVLTDVIISEYLPMDPKVLLEYYSGYEEMLHAMRSSSGSDHDIKEKYWPGSDMIYHDMIRYMKEVKGIRQARSITQLPLNEKQELAGELKNAFGATDMQLNKFLHIRLEDSEMKKETEREKACRTSI